MKTLTIYLSIILSVLMTSSAFANDAHDVFQTAEQDMLTVTVVATPNPLDYSIVGLEQTENAIETAMEIMREDISSDQNATAVVPSSMLNTSI